MKNTTVNKNHPWRPLDFKPKQRPKYTNLVDTANREREQWASTPVYEIALATLGSNEWN